MLEEDSILGRYLPSVRPGFCLNQYWHSAYFSSCMQGTVHSFGNINKNQWYSTVISGKIKLLTFSAYAPFEPGNAWHFEVILLGMESQITLMTGRQSQI